MALHIVHPQTVHEARIFLGIDVGKYEHCICPLVESARGLTYGRTEFVKNNTAGFERLKRKISMYGIGTCFVLLERTGHYGDLLTEFLLAQDVEIYAIQVQERDLDDKSDKIDARNLAEMLYQQAGLRMGNIKREQRIHRVLPATPVAKRLRGLAQRHCELVRELTRTKNRLKDLQNRLFPEFKDAIKDTNCPTALRIRELFPTPADLAAAPISDILACRLPKARTPSNKTLLALQRLAQTSIGVEIKNPEICLEQTQLIHTLRLLDQQIEILEQTIIPVVESTREGKILQSIPMISPVWAAYLIAGIGSIANFSSASKLCAYAGWVPKQRQSGKTLNGTSFSKAGNRLIKSVMYFITLQAIRQPTVWRDMYGPLVERLCPYDARLKKRVHRMRVVTRIGNQILRLVYLLLKKDHDLLARIAAGSEPPPPALYDPDYHRARCAHTQPLSKK